MTPRLVSCSQQSSSMMGMDLAVLMSHEGSSGITFFFHELSSLQILGKARIISRGGLPLDMGTFLDFAFIGLAHTSVPPCHSPPWTTPGVLCYRNINSKCPCLPLGMSYPSSSYSLNVICSLLLLLIFILSKGVSFIPFRAAQSSQILPPLSNSPWWLLSHAGSSALNFNTSVSLSHRVQQHSTY